MAQTMLGAMLDIELNPQFHTPQFVSSVSSELGNQIYHLGMPIEEIDPLLYLPSWLCLDSMSS
jgi:hypothetical protein